MTAPSCVPASSSALPWALDSDAHDTRKLQLRHSSNSIKYISRPIRAKLFCITSLLPQQHLLLYKYRLHHCLLLLDIPRADVKILFLCFLTRACQETVSYCFASLLALPPTCLPRRPQVATSQVCPVPVFIATSIAFIYFIASCGAASCSCKPELPSGTALPVRTGHPCGMVGIILCGASPCSIELALATWCHFIK